MYTGRHTGLPKRFNDSLDLTAVIPFGHSHNLEDKY